MNPVPNFKAVIFDLDGVISKTALVHSKAWKEMFDNFLLEREAKYHEVFKEFNHETDYLTFVDGKPRYEGVKSFLESRDINLPFGNENDSTEMETICGIGNRKNITFNKIIERDGVDPYPSTVALIHQLKKAGVKVGVASSSKNCSKVLTALGLMDVIETRVDGEVSAELGLNGKPEPDIFTTAAKNLNVSCHESVVVEDAISGVQAAKKGNFGLVLGLAREDNEAALYANGADIVVSDISEIGFEGITNWFEKGSDEDKWSISYYDYLPQKERSREALLSVGNGNFGVRGAMEETKINDINYPGTYLSAVYNTLSSVVGGKEVTNEDLVNATNFFQVNFKIDDEDWLDINQTKILVIKRNLNFKTAVLTKELIVEDAKGRQTKIISQRFASMDQPNFAAIEYSIIPQNYSGKLTVKSVISGNHINAGVKRYQELNQQHLESLNELSENNFQYVAVKTTQSKITIATSARLDVLHNDKLINVPFENFVEPAVSTTLFSVELAANEKLSLQKKVFIKQFSDKDEPQIQIEAINKIKNISTFQQLLSDSKIKWEQIWKEIDVEIEGDRFSQKMLRLNLYHLMSTTSHHNIDIDFGIPARGLTGEAYRGHVFWDELYILPVYFIHFKEIARSVLMYRYRRLAEAKQYASENGYKGAMFPWQSGSSGAEETQKFHFNPLSGLWGDDHSCLQRHVSLAIAYNILMYHQITTDQEFMLGYGAEMLVEICRFWESKTEFNPKTGRYSIAKVMGPDEFHETLPGSADAGLKDNAYSNLMTVWMFSEAIKYLNEISEEAKSSLLQKLNLKDDEINKWKHISENLNLVISDNEIISQYDGYFNLKELDWEGYKKKYGNIYRMDRILKAENLSPDEYKVAKQADTLMIFYNLNINVVKESLKKLNYNLSDDFVEKNIEYYFNRTSHGSTLSRVVHSFLASKVNNQKLSWDMFYDAVGSDFVDIQGGTTAEGIHTGVMAGTVYIALFAYAGIDLSSNNLKISPSLPKHWKSIGFNFRFKQSRYFCKISQNSIQLLADNPNLPEVELNGKIYNFENGKIEINYKKK